MAATLIVTTELLGTRPAGPGLRAQGIACGLAQAGFDVALVAPSGSTSADVPILSLRELKREIRRADAVIAPASILALLPEIRTADRLCVDFAGPYPLEAAASHLPPSTIRAAEVSAADAVVAADLVLCAHKRQVEYAMDLMRRLRPDQQPTGPRFALVPFGIQPRGSNRPAQRVRDGALRVVWPGGLWDWLDPLIAVTALSTCTTPVTIDFWGARNPDPRAPAATRASAVVDLAKRLGVEERVFLTDWIDADRFDRELAGFDLAITFDDAGPEATHAFRTRLLHALAVGVPTLATTGEYVADLAASRGAGWTVPPNDPDALATMLTRIATTRDAIEQASAQALTLAAEFSYDDLVSPLADWLRQPGQARPRAAPTAHERVRRALRRGLR
ncbi:MAG: hypothetical protein RL190_2161 [Actinomycetota bacterium]